MPRTILGPLLSLAVLVAAALLGGLYNSVEAQGRAIDDWSGKPLVAEIKYGQRLAKSAEDGTFYFGFVPRDARLNARALGYGSVDFGPDEREVRMQPATLTLQVNDAATAKGVASPEARKDDRVIGRGTATGNMVIAPHPGRGVPFVICSAGYAPKEVKSDTNVVEVTLQPGAGCPPLPGASFPPSPTPAASPTPTPSPTP